jgi:Holliday junction resolvase RusA-like endonuclease
MQKKHTDIPMKKDVTNLLKSTEDAILEALGQNDKKVFDTVLHKIHTNNEKDARFILSLISISERVRMFS